MGQFDVAQICLNGHVVNSETRRYPQFSRPFCDECGKPTISECPFCSKQIPGEYHVPRVIGSGGFRAPAFCAQCGKPMPWTETRLQAAREMIEEMDELSPEEKAKLSASLPDLSHDTPQSGVAVTRMKKLALKVGKGGWEMFQKVITDVASDTVKKTLGLP